MRQVNFRRASVLTAVATATVLGFLAAGGPIVVGRTLSAAESSRLFGGEVGKECGVVADCGSWGNCHDNDNGDPGSCSEHVEWIPIEDAANKACNVPKQGYTCKEGVNQDCSTGYACEYDTDTDKCYRTGMEREGIPRGRAPASCEASSILGPPIPEP